MYRKIQYFFHACIIAIKESDKLKNEDIGFY